MPVYLYWGEEDFNIENSLRLLREEVLDANLAILNHKKFIEPDIRILIENLQIHVLLCLAICLSKCKLHSFFTRGKKSYSDEILKN